MRGRHLDSYEASSSLTYGGLACPMMLFERDICADDGPKFAAHAIEMAARYRRIRFIFAKLGVDAIPDAAGAGLPAGN